MWSGEDRIITICISNSKPYHMHTYLKFNDHCDYLFPYNLWSIHFELKDSPHNSVTKRISQHQCRDQLSQRNFTCRHSAVYSAVCKYLNKEIGCCVTLQNMSGLRDLLNIHNDNTGYQADRNNIM